jgi:hypothetical protein
MAKITIEELYRGEKYDIMSAVPAKALSSALTSEPWCSNLNLEGECCAMQILTFLCLYY